MTDPFAIILVSIFAIAGVLIGWWSAMLWRKSRVITVARTWAPEVEKPIFRRPAEFGPILQPRDYVDRLRDAIIEDQLGARRESPKQRRQRITRYRPFTDRQRVQHWLLHWQEDYVYALTGTGWA